MILVEEIHNDMISPISEGGYFFARTVDIKSFIGDISLRKYTQKYIKPSSNRKNITCWCETCLSDMLLQSDINK